MSKKLTNAALALRMTAIAALAQNVSSSIVGNVRDASGASISTAAVTAIHEGTNIETKTQTGMDGEFVIPGLPLGPYTVRIEAAGFKPNVVRNLNHANFGNPGANISVPGSLGRITSAGDSRQIQFGAKLLF